MDCTCERHDHRGPLDESTENCTVDGCECTTAPEGYVVPNTDAEAGDVPASGDYTAPEPEELTPPNHSALKEEWVAFAVAKGMAETDAALLTKDELIARFGS